MGTRAAVIFDNLGPYHRARLKSGSDVCQLLAIEVAPSSADYFWKFEPTPEFERVTLLSSGTSRSVSRQEITQRLSKVFLDFRPDVVFIPGWASRIAVAATLWCCDHRIPAVVMSESTSWDDLRLPWKEWTKSRIVGTFSAALVGGQAHSEYIQSLGMPRERIFVGYDAIDNDYFARGAEKARATREECRKRYGLQERYFLASARFIEKKNLAGLLQGYRKYRDLMTDHEGDFGNVEPWDLVLLGEGQLKAPLQNLCESLNLSGHVKMPGFQQYPDLPAYYALAQAFIHPSSIEPWGLVVNEAMACGLPVLVSNRAGCAGDLVQPGCNGFTFDPYATDEIATLLVRLTLMPHEQRKELGSASRRIISAWGPDAFAQGLRAALNVAVQSPTQMPKLIDRGVLGMCLLR